MANSGSRGLVLDGRAGARAVRFLLRVNKLDYSSAYSILVGQVPLKTTRHLLPGFKPPNFANPALIQTQTSHALLNPSTSRPPPAVPALNRSSAPPSPTLSGRSRIGSSCASSRSSSSCSTSSATAILSGRSSCVAELLPAATASPGLAAVTEQLCRLGLVASTCHIMHSTWRLSRVA